jgi:hypothetical protein
MCANRDAGHCADVWRSIAPRPALLGLRSEPVMRWLADDTFGRLCALFPPLSAAESGVTGRHGATAGAAGREVIATDIRLYDRGRPPRQSPSGGAGRGAQPPWWPACRTSPLTAHTAISVPQLRADLTKSRVLARLLPPPLLCSASTVGAREMARPGACGPRGTRRLGRDWRRRACRRRPVTPARCDPLLRARRVCAFRPHFRPRPVSATGHAAPVHGRPLAGAAAPRGWRRARLAASARSATIFVVSGQAPPSCAMNDPAIACPLLRPAARPAMLWCDVDRAVCVTRRSLTCAGRATRRGRGVRTYRQPGRGLRPLSAAEAQPAAGQPTWLSSALLAGPARKPGRPERPPAATSTATDRGPWRTWARHPGSALSSRGSAIASSWTWARTPISTEAPVTTRRPSSTAGRAQGPGAGSCRS